MQNPTIITLHFTYAVIIGQSMQQLLLLTLGAHAQRGLQYLVCVSVCLSVTTFSATARNNALNKIYQRLQRDMSKVLVMAFSLTMLRSEVMASFAYCESHRHYYRDPELIPSMAQGYKVVQKPNRALNATCNTGIQVNAMQRAISFSVMDSIFFAFFRILSSY